MITTYQKVLSPNDTGETDSHQAGICVPKSDRQLLDFFPALDATTYNPDTWLFCIDDSGEIWKMRYVFYNGKLLGRNSRNEYRITHTSKYLKKWKAGSGDRLVFRDTSRPGHYRISVVPDRLTAGVREDPDSNVIVLKGWSRVC